MTALDNKRSQLADSRAQKKVVKADEKAAKAALIAKEREEFSIETAIKDGRLLALKTVAKNDFKTVGVQFGVISRDKTRLKTYGYGYINARTEACREQKDKMVTAILSGKSEGDSIPASVTKLG